MYRGNIRLSIGMPDGSFQEMGANGEHDTGTGLGSWRVRLVVDHNRGRNLAVVQVIKALRNAGKECAEEVRVHSG